ncbi:hypothetical protein KUV50_02530 [Membranicola marinus]|uniref:Uncharacterized protein n=1 Tax=Membranihabitans marinus TaxID=1227546 RepID=A0A953HJG2_9BACT|nr:hypothetical protein [Membranihabitans marinus]MBY5956994.1 hypothetical protein [Membranihabitans marinus]
MAKIIKIAATVLVLGGFMWSCQSETNDEIPEIALKIRSNECRIAEIANYVDDSWTTSIQELSDYLPETLPEQERENILHLKSADLIRMFESYEDFDPEGHELVDSMEQLDIQWADSLRHLSLQNKNLSMKMDSLFSMVTDAEKEEELYSIVDEIQKRPCPVQ